MSIGVDIEDVARFKRLVRNRRFLDHVFAAEEIRFCQKKSLKFPFFAERFAAKEAVWKALSSVMDKKKHPLLPNEICIRTNSKGIITAHLPAPYKSISKHLSISMSSTRNSVIAIAIHRRG